MSVWWPVLWTQLCACPTYRVTLSKLLLSTWALSSINTKNEELVINKIRKPKIACTQCMELAFIVAKLHASCFLGVMFFNAHHYIV
jgi:hypothetical protein